MNSLAERHENPSGCLNKKILTGLENKPRHTVVYRQGWCHPNRRRVICPPALLCFFAGEGLSFAFFPCMPGGVISVRAFSASSRDPFQSAVLNMESVFQSGRAISKHGRGLLHKRVHGGAQLDSQCCAAPPE